MMLGRKKYLVATLGVLSYISAANAADKPEISGRHYGAFNIDTVTSYSDLDSTTLDTQYNTVDTYVEFNSNYEIKFNGFFAVNTSWWFHNLKSAEAGKDRVLDDEGLVMEELYARFYDDQAEFYIGKINPKFGKGWDLQLNTGMWGKEFAEEYKIVGKLGVGIKAKLDLEEYGEHVVDFNSFYTDTSDLNDSILTRRDVTSGNMGKAGDNDSLSSYSVNIAGKDMESIPSLFYNLSYRNVNSGGVQLIDDEEGYSAAVGVAKDLVGDLKFKPFIEYTKITDFNTVNNRFGFEFGDNDLPGDYKYLTLVFPFQYNDWSFNYVTMFKDISTSTSSLDVDQEEVSISYKLPNGITIGLGRKQEEYSTGVKYTTAGISIDFTNEF